jgi:hypothetical protein
MQIVRRNVNDRTREAILAGGLTCELRMSDARGGGPRLLFRVEDEWLTPGEAADRYLPGGFAANF